MSSYCYNRLAPELRPVYDSFVQAFSSGSRSVVVGGNFSPSDFSTVVSAVKFDRPEQYEIDFAQNPQHGNVGLTGNLSLTFDGLEGGYETAAELERIRASFLKYRDMPEYDRVYAVKQYLADNVEYSAEAYESAKKGEEYDHRLMTIAGALIDKKATCEGFTKAAVYLLDYLGIECGAAEGRRDMGDDDKSGQNNHAWNIVRVNGAWYHMDVAADAKIVVNKYCSVIPNRHFLLNDEMMGKIVEISGAHNCTELKDNYFVRNGLSFDNLADLRHYLECFHNIGNCLAFRYTGEEGGERLDRMTAAVLERRVPGKTSGPIEPLNGLYYYVIF